MQKSFNQAVTLYLLILMQTANVHAQFFNPEKENLLWGVTSNGELAYFSQFDSLEKESSKQTLKMNILSESSLNYDKITSIFSITD